MASVLHLLQIMQHRLTSSTGHQVFAAIAQQQRGTVSTHGIVLGLRVDARATMTSPAEDPTLQKIDELLNRLRAWQADATKLLSDPDIRERAEHALLDVGYVFEYLKAARSEKEEKLKLAG